MEYNRLMITWIVVFCIGFTCLITMQVVCIFENWRTQQAMMTIMASYSPTAELEAMLSKYFLQNLQDTKESKRRKWDAR